MAAEYKLLCKFLLYYANLALCMKKFYSALNKLKYRTNIFWKILTTVRLLWLRGFSGEEQPFWSANKILNIKWWWDLHAQNALHFSKSRFLYIAAWMLTRRHGNSIHFHLFVLINVVARIVIFECLWNPFRNFICNIMLLANWQANYIHTYQIWF